MQDTKHLVSEIKRLKQERNAVILAHYYQTGDMQDIADFVGDSFALSKKAKDTDADLIVFCGVRFMAESAKILSPEKTVLLPAPDAGCPMADMVTPEDVQAPAREVPRRRGGLLRQLLLRRQSGMRRVRHLLKRRAESCVRLPEKQVIFVPGSEPGAVRGVAGARKGNHPLQRLLRRASPHHRGRRGQGESRSARRAFAGASGMHRGRFWKSGFRRQHGTDFGVRGKILRRRSS